MKHKRGIVVVLTLAVLAGLLVAAPASANKMNRKQIAGMSNPGPAKDAGTLTGTVIVGKNRTGCTNGGVSTVSGAGLGLPAQAQKNTYYEVGNSTPATATSLFNMHVGVLKVCGRLTKVASAAGGGVGAACGATKGWDGKGTITYPGIPGKQTVWLDKIGWKASATLIVLTGQAVVANDAAEAKAKKATANDVFTAEIQPFGAQGCATKAGSGSNKTGGGTQFGLAGGYQVANGSLADPNSAPGTCKRGLSNGCAYDPKKPGKNG